MDPNIKKKKQIDTDEEQKFAICHGKQTQEEKDYLLKIGLTYENSDGEILEVSTLTESDFADNSLFEESYASVSKDSEAGENIQQIEVHNRTVDDDIRDELLSSSTGVSSCYKVEDITTLHGFCAEQGNAKTTDSICVSSNNELDSGEARDSTQLIEAIDTIGIDFGEEQLNALNMYMEEDKENLAPVEKISSLSVSKTPNMVLEIQRLVSASATSETGPITNNDDSPGRICLKEIEMDESFSLSMLSESTVGLTRLFPSTPAQSIRCSSDVSSLDNDNVKADSIHLSTVSPVTKCAVNSVDNVSIVPATPVANNKPTGLSIPRLSQSNLGLERHIIPATPVGPTRNEIFSVSSLSESSVGLKRLFRASIPPNQVENVKAVRQGKDQKKQNENAFSISALSESSVLFKHVLPATPIRGNQVDKLDTLLRLPEKDQDEQENKDTFSVSAMSDTGFGLQRLFPATPVTTSQVLRRSLRIAQKSYTTDFDCSNMSQSGMGLSGIFNERREPVENQMESNHNLSQNLELDADATSKPELVIEDISGQFHISTPISKYSAFINGVQDSPQPVLLTKRVAELKNRSLFSPNKKQTPPKQFRTSTPRAVKVACTSSVNIPHQETIGITSLITEKSLNLEANASPDSSEVVSSSRVVDSICLNSGKGFELEADSPCLINLHSSLSTDVKSESLMAFEEAEERITAFESNNSDLLKGTTKVRTDPSIEGEEKCEAEAEDSFSVSTMSETGIGLRELFPSTPVTTKQGLRRSFRIPQKTLNISSVSQGGITVAELFNETESVENRTETVPMNMSQSQTPQENAVPIECLELDYLVPDADGSILEDVSDVTQDVSLSMFYQLDVKSPIAPALINDNMLNANEGELKISSDEIEDPNREYIAKDNIADDPSIEINCSLDGSKIEDVTDMTQDVELSDVSVLETQVESAIVALDSIIVVDVDNVLNGDKKTFADESVGFDDNFNAEQRGLLDVSNVSEDLCVIMATQEVPVNRTFENDNDDASDTVDVAHGLSIINATQERILNRTFDSQESIIEGVSNGPQSEDVSVIMDTQEVVLNRTFNSQDNVIEYDVVSDFEQEASLSIREQTMNRTFETENNKEYFDDTIENMERILAAADAQELKEAEERKLQVEVQINTDASENSNYKNKTPNPENAPEYLLYSDRKRGIRESLVKSGGGGFGSGAKSSPKPVMLAKRINELKKKGSFFSPSPPRPRPAVVLPKTIPKNQPSQAFKAPTPRPVKIAGGSSTPVYQPGTPKRQNLAGVLAKVDTGLRSPSVSLGLNSPVANYIHSKAAPSPFHRNPGMPNKAQSTGKQWHVSLQQVQAVPFVPGVYKSSLTPKSPLPQTPTGLIAQRSSLSGVMSSSKFNSRQGTPTSAAALEPKFKKQIYTGPPQGQVRSNNDLSFEQKHSKENYKAQRHMGKRDSGNASIVQNAVISKQFLPSRPAPGIDK